jgi:hypothetical protein
MIHQSSNIQRSEYDAETQTMTVEFVHGGITQVVGMPPAEYAAFARSGSPGSYWHVHIKQNPDYKIVKLTGARR